MSESRWQFFVDVGGTFTDVVARQPDGTLVTLKLLSSGVVRGVVGAGSLLRAESGRNFIIDSRFAGQADGLWAGYAFRLVDSDSVVGGSSQAVAARVARFEGLSGTFHFDASLPAGFAIGSGFALSSGEEAPVVAIRCLMGLSLGDAIGSVDVRLGTTRATNALLERKGSRVGFVTTRGFGDILKIGNQDRPELFALNVRKRDDLAECAVEVDERMSATGDVLVSLDEVRARATLTEMRKNGIEAVAICLLHAHINPDHEEQLAGIAEDVGFSQISVSSRLSRVEKIVSRGDTTVADAYLGGVMGAYVASLRRSMPDARIKLMTSSGGLIDAANVTGKDTVLSGPAGGVVGCAYVTRAAGFDRAIGFDMGGTSTDVSRVEAASISPFEYQHETVKAGVRIQTPMIAIETVAAGGGSLCLFDGQKLVVGPHSAGSEPGPACYGRGGPLTVTDMNVALGRVVADRFPFPLDEAIVERKLAALGAEVNRVTGASLRSVGLAAGFVEIAVAHMASAIRKISIAKGYDVSKYVLTTFGGAGGQHACAIARRLGIRRVLCNRFAGVLSALGIGVASAKRIVERSIQDVLDEGVAARLACVFVDVGSQARRAILADGESEDELDGLIETVDLCYTGQASLISVDFGDWVTMRAAFESKHKQLYGYTHEGRAIEVRAVRVALSGKRRDVPLNETAANRGASCTKEIVRMVVAGEMRDVPLHKREALSIGDAIDGPAIVIEDTSTIVIDEGWRGEVSETGDLVLTDGAVAAAKQVVGTAADPVQLELFNNQFASIAEQMGTTLRRTALSTNVKERLDFSCAVFTSTGDLVVNAPHIPVHLGAMSECVQALMEDVGTFAPGDVYVTNDPYRGGSHLNDVTVVTPVHDADGALIFLVASRAHHAEIGGMKPGSMPPDSTCLADEGVVIRAFRWMKNGQPQVEVFRSLLVSGRYPSRTPDENIADVGAQVAANQTGVRELLGMVDRYGLGVVLAYMRHIQHAAEQKARAAIAKLPDGRHRFEDRLDDGSAIRLCISIAGDRAVFDFAGTDPVLSGNLNANLAIVTSAVLYCIRCLIDEDIPLNSGVLAPVEILLPACFLNPSPGADPEKSPAVAGGNVETSQRVTDCVLGALGAVAASQGTMNNVLLGNERFGYYETICGGAGAGDGFDGADAVHTHMTNTRLTDPEVLESRYPVRLVRFAIREGSGGDGLYRGGCGVVREIEFLEPLDVSIISQRRTVGPYGLRGGESGKSGVNLLVRCDGSEHSLGSIASVRVARGDRLRLETPGGGGWGQHQSQGRGEGRSKGEVR
jgi:5-oxoprolinase (ATP-hydrolysing)